ncbi:MAG: N-acetylmuramoyl-L-alanine amidase [Clostridia bacterium]|nr:N-acetylmuramoyl-L-alanine amidase [Clostridia bacterium]
MWIAVINRPNKAWLWTLIMGLLLLLFYAFLSWGKEDEPVLAAVLAGRVIAVDAGHGGDDPGAIGSNGLIEKEVTWQVAQKLQGYLQEAGATVIMTRKEQPFIQGSKREDLQYRLNLAKEEGAELLLSIHVNSFPKDASQHGAQVFSSPDSPASRQLALLLQEELIANLGHNQRAAKESSNYFLTQNAAMPSVIAEIGFASNPEEERLLAQPEYQDQIAFSLFSGIVRYYFLMDNEKE